MPEPDSPIDSPLAKGYEMKAAESLQRQNSSGQEFDKQLVYIAGGGLALTLTFAKEIAALTGKHFLLLLLLTWLCFALSLLFNLISHRKAASSYAAIANVNSHYLERHTANLAVDQNMAAREIKKALSSQAWVVRLNVASLYGVGIGMGSFILFIFLNFFTMSETPPNSQPPTIPLNKAMQPDLIKGLEAPSSLFPTPPPAPQPSPVVDSATAAPAQSSSDSLQPTK